MPVDEVEIIPINLLPDASPGAVDLTTNIPLGIAGDPNSKKANLEAIAAVISEQIGSVTVPDPSFYLVDGPGPNDPAAGGNTVNDTSLNGMDYSLHKWGIGPLRKGTDWQNDVVGGGWRLTDELFISGEMYTVVPKPEVSNILAAPGAIGRLVTGVQDITSDGTIPAIHYRKLLNIKGASNVTLPLCSEYPVNILLPIVTSDGPQKQTTFSRQGTDIIDNNGSGIAEVILGNREFLQLITDGTKWYILDVSPAAFADPQPGFGYFAGTSVTDFLAPNQIPALGGVYNRADYPRVVRFINKLKAVNAAFVKSAGDWPTNRTFWGDGNGTTTFQAPDLGGYFPRWLDGASGPFVDSDRQASGLNSAPSSAQNDQNRAHTHGLDPRILTEGVPGGGPGGPTPGSSGIIAATSSDGGVEARPINAGFFPIFNI